MNKNWLEVAEQQMQIARSRNEADGPVAAAVEAILMYFSEVKKPGSRLHNIMVDQAHAHAPAFTFPNDEKVPSMKVIDEILLKQMKKTHNEIRAAQYSVADEQDSVDNKMGEYIANGGLCSDEKCVCGSKGCGGPAGVAKPDDRDHRGCVVEHGRPQPITTALDVLRTLNSIRPLGDIAYDIREREGEGWEGPQVKAWGKACDDMNVLFKKDDHLKAKEANCTFWLSLPGHRTIKVSHGTLARKLAGVLPSQRTM